MGLVRFVGYYPSGLGKNNNSIIVITDRTFELIFGVSSNQIIILTQSIFRQKDKSAVGLIITIKLTRLS